MKIERFEDIKGWQHGRVLAQMVRELTRKEDFSRDFALRDQISRAAGSVMHNVAEGFDAEGDAEFVRFLRYAKRSCSEVQSQLYEALDAGYIAQTEFQRVCDQAAETRKTLRGFINYLSQSR